MSKNMKTYPLPPMWEDAKRNVPEIIKKILEDDYCVRRIEINFSASVDEVPTLTYCIERYVFGGKEEEK